MFFILIYSKLWFYSNKACAIFILGTIAEKSFRNLRSEYGREKSSLKNLSTIPAEFQWNSTGVMENYWKMTGTNGTSGILLKFRWNSSSS